MKPLGDSSLTKIISTILNLIWWVEWIGCSVLIAVILVTGFLNRGISVNFPISFSHVELKTVPGVNGSISPGIINVTGGNFYLPVTNSWQNILVLLAAGIVVSAIFIIITYQLKLLFSSLSNNQLFDTLNVSRIRNTGIGLIVVWLLLFLSNIFINWYLRAHFSWDKEISLTYSFNIGYLVAGIILIIVAQIFKEGVTLKEETSLTI